MSALYEPASPVLLINKILTHVFDVQSFETYMRTRI